MFVRDFPVHWLRLCVPSAEVSRLIPGQRTRSHLLQVKTNTQTNKQTILHASVKI